MRSLLGGRHYGGLLVSIQEPVMAENAFFVDPPKSEIKSKTP